MLRMESSERQRPPAVLRRHRLFGVAAVLGAALTLGACGDDGEVREDLGNPFPDYGDSCSDCDGCCQNGTCLPGNTNNACGVGGLTCQICGFTQNCVEGSCIEEQPTCGPTTCSSGCCDSGGQCQSPPTEAACGLGGATCTECDGDKICSEGQCVPPGGGAYSVVVVSAELDNGDCSDNYVPDSCDTVAEVALGDGTPVSTPEQRDTDRPAWNFKVFSAAKDDLTSKQLHVKITDLDVVWDDLLGECDLTITESHLTAGKIESDCGEKVANLTIAFNPVE